MLAEFLTAIAEMTATGSVHIYHATEKDGTVVDVSVESRRADGYNSQYFKLKEVIVEPNKAAYIRKYDLSSLELVHKLIMMSIEEGHYDLENGRSRCTKTNKANNTTNTRSNSYKPAITHQAQSRSVNQNISKPTNPVPEYSQRQETTTINESFQQDYPVGGLDSELESFMGGGVKIANMRTSSNNEPKSSQFRDSIASLLDSEL